MYSGSVNTSQNNVEHIPQINIPDSKYDFISLQPNILGNSIQIDAITTARIITLRILYFTKYITPKFPSNLHFHNTVHNA